MKTVAIVLAAGYSSRFQGHKLKAVLSSGRSVFLHTLDNLAGSTDQLIVVTQTDMSDYVETSLKQASAETGASIVINRNPQQGMGSSIAAGVRHLETTPGAAESVTGCLLCLADMPFVQTSSYRQIAQALEPARIVVPTVGGRRANPVAFGRAYFRELKSLATDTGGRSILRDHPGKVLELEIDDKGLIADVDTEEELLRYQEELLP